MTDKTTNTFPELAPEPYRSFASASPDSAALTALIAAAGAEAEADVDALADPIGEAAHSPVPFLVRKLRDRALYIASSACAVHCRFCFRRASGLFGAPPPSLADLANAARWVGENKEISEVVISGGDPLMLDAAMLGSTLNAFGQLPNISRLRIHTRRPVVDPASPDPAMLDALKASPKPLSLVLHIAHPAEITKRVLALAGTLSEAGVFTSSQTVLLAGVNDNSATLRELFERLEAGGYPSRYLHHPDRVSGGARFRVTLERGLALHESLGGARGLPAYIIDLPDGSGKTPVRDLLLIDREERSGKTRRKYRWERPASWDGASGAESFEWWDIWSV